MSTTLRLDPPTVPGCLTSQPLLLPIRNLAAHFSGTAMRAWWQCNTENDLAHNGMRVWREHILTQNSQASSPSLPLKLLATHDKEGRQLLLAVFADASAAVLRSVQPAAALEEPMDLFHVLPIPLRLSTSHRPLDDRPKLHLGVSSEGRRHAPPKIMLSIDKDGQKVDLDTGETGPKARITPTLCQALQADLMAETLAWGAQIDALPILHRPEEGMGIAPEGILGTTISRDLDIEPGLPYACPNFLPFSGITNSERAELAGFADDVISWLLFTGSEAVWYLDATVLGTRIPSGSRSASPRAKINALTQAGSSLVVDHAETNSLTEILSKLLCSPMAPVPWDRIISQQVNPGTRETIAEERLVYVSRSRDRLNLSRHDQLRLFSKFGDIRQLAGSLPLLQTELP